MRIALVSDQFPPMVGGVSTVAKNLSHGLAARGHQVWVIAPSESLSTKVVIENQVTVHRFGSFEWPSSNDMRIAFLPLMTLGKVLLEIQPDIVHLHSPVVLGMLARFLSQLGRKPVVATNHYLPVNLTTTSNRDPVWSKVFDAAFWTYLIQFYNQCDLVTAPTQAALQLLLEYGLTPPSLAISNGIDLQRFSPGKPASDLAQLVGLPDNSRGPFVLYVGRLSGEKRLDVLIQGAAKAFTSTPGYLIIAGKGQEAAELEKLAQEAGIAHQVAFLGHVADELLPDLYRLADLFVMPSEAELQSLATLEAMATAKPVIAADAYALPELVHHQENGLIFPPGDANALSGCLTHLLGSAKLRSEFGQKSLEIAQTHEFSKVLARWEEVYQGAIEGKQPAMLGFKLPTISLPTSKPKQ